MPTTEEVKQLIAVRRLRDELQRRRRAGRQLSSEQLAWLRKAQRALLESEHGAGCVAARRSRATGALVQLYAPGTQSDDPGWFVVCTAHATCVQIETRKLGEWAVSHPEGFCDGCREVVS